MAVVTREDFANWLEDPVTKRLKEQIKEDVLNMHEMLLEADYDADLNRLQGRIKACRNLLEVSYEDLYK